MFAREHRAPESSRKFAKGILGALFISSLLLTSPALANASFVMPGGGGDYKMRIKTFSDHRFNTVVRQKFDFSCGSAAIATLLTYHYNIPVDEMEVLNAMYAHGDHDKIHREGFSLLDMKNYLNVIGLEAEGYRESMSRLIRVGIPAIVLINKKGYLHFVVVKGAGKDKVSVGDPSRGTVIYSRKDFEKMWNGILFVITDNMKTGRNHFNTASAWKPYGLPHFRNMLDTGQLSSVTLATAFSPGYY